MVNLLSFDCCFWQFVSLYGRWTLCAVDRTLSVGCAETCKRNQSLVLWMTPAPSAGVEMNSTINIYNESFTILYFRHILLLFMLMGWEYVFEPRPVTGLLFIPQMIYESGEPWWNYTDRIKPQNLPRATLSTINPTWADLGTNPGLRRERTPINRLSHFRYSTPPVTVFQLPDIWKRCGRFLIIKI
jgi:hypothetical protein